MTPGQQSIVALAIVALAAGWLLWRLFSRRSPRGCGNPECHALTPEMKKFQATLKR
jgi:hypothetical protein